MKITKTLLKEYVLDAMSEIVKEKLNEFAKEVDPYDKTMVDIGRDDTQVGDAPSQRVDTGFGKKSAVKRKELQIKQTEQEKLQKVEILKKVGELYNKAGEALRAGNSALAEQLLEKAGELYQLTMTHKQIKNAKSE